MSNSMRAVVAAGVMAIANSGVADAAPLVFAQAGSAPLITGTVNDFRDAIGPQNANTPVNFVNGRREINWDGVPDSASDPNLLPGNFFNAGVAGRARGIEFTTPGTGFLVSAKSASGQPPAFGFPSDFIPFSGERMFTPIGSTITDVRFFDPAHPAAQATTRAFGAVFEDVESPISKLSYFDLSGNLLLSVDVPMGNSGSLSFAGALFDTAVVARVRIETGDGVLTSNGNYASGVDGVVMDDFIFGEPTPVPLPAPFALLAGALGGLGVFSRRRRTTNA